MRQYELELCNKLQQLCMISLVNHTSSITQKKTQEFWWAPAASEALNKIKCCLTSEPLLQRFDPLKLIHIFTNALGYATTATLIQQYDNLLYPVWSHTPKGPKTSSSRFPRSWINTSLWLWGLLPNTVHPIFTSTKLLTNKLHKDVPYHIAV